MKLHCSYSIVYTAILFCSFDEATCFTTKKNVDRNIDTKYRHSHYISRLHLSSIDQARINGLDGFYYPPLLEDDSEQSDTYNNDNMRSKIMSSLPSSQPQIPLHMRIAKGVYEELFPWIVTLIFPTLGALSFHSSTPFQMCALGEVIFLTYCTHKLITNFDIPSTPEPLLGDRRWEYVSQSMWDSVPKNIEARRSFFMGYFYDAPFDNLRREDAVSCLAWMRYGLPLENGDFTDEIISNLETFDLPQLENQINYGNKLPRRKEGEDKLGVMRFNLEPIRYRHKPMVYYFVTHAMYWWARHLLSNELGFQYFPAKDKKTDIGYWYKPAKKSTAPAGGKSKDQSEESPLVFVHGIGGITFYCSFIQDLVAAVDTNVPIILLDLPHISLKVNDDIPEIVSQVDSVCKILDSTIGREHDGTPKKATFVGHSFGSVLLSWMVQSNPERLNNCIFMDPICFQLHLKNILYNFHMQRMDKRLQKDFQWTNPLSVEGIVNLAGTEMHTNYATLRKFSWATNELWPKDLMQAKISASILLSENDEIVPTQEVEKQIENFNSKKFERSNENFVKSYVFKNASHGEMFLSEELRKTTVQKVLAMLRLQNINNVESKRSNGNRYSTTIGKDDFMRLQNLWHPDGFIDHTTIPSIPDQSNNDSIVAER